MLQRGAVNEIVFYYYPAASFSYTVQYKYGDEVLHTTEPIVPEAQTITVRANADVLNEQLWNGYTLNDEETKRVTLSATEENVVVFQMKPAVLHQLFAQYSGRCDCGHAGEPR